MTILLFLLDGQEEILRNHLYVETAGASVKPQIKTAMQGVHGQSNLTNEASPTCMDCASTAYAGIPHSSGD